MNKTGRKLFAYLKHFNGFFFMENIIQHNPSQKNRVLYKEPVCSKKLYLWTDVNDQQYINASINLYGVKSISGVLPIRKIQINTFRMQKLRGFPLLVLILYSRLIWRSLGPNTNLYYWCIKLELVLRVVLRLRWSLFRFLF